MTGEHTDKHLAEAVESEYGNCVKNHGGFKNHHEAYAVTLEEVQEVTEAASLFPVIANGAMHELWNMIRKDEAGEDAVAHLEKLEGITEELVKEGIQVLAMCRKWHDLIVKENE